MANKHENLRTVLFSEQLLPDKARGIIECRLKTAIEKGALAPGTRITQQSVADIFKFSRMPVREAFLMLDTQGYLINIPNRGYVVAENAPHPAMPDGLSQFLIAVKIFYQGLSNHQEREAFKREIVRLIREP